MDTIGQRFALPGLALNGPLAAHHVQLLADARDAVLHAAAVGFQLRFAFAATHADATFLPGQMAPETRQAREQVLELGKFDLQLAFTRARALREDIQDQRRAVQQLAIEQFFQVAALRGGQFLVEDHGVHIQLPAELGEFIGLALADVGGGVGGLELLHAVADDVAASRGGEFSEFGEGIAGLPIFGGF